jgi:hypothetical protein
MLYIKFLGLVLLLMVALSMVIFRLHLLALDLLSMKVLCGPFARLSRLLPRGCDLVMRTLKTPHMLDLHFRDSSFEKRIHNGGELDHNQDVVSCASPTIQFKTRGNFNRAAYTTGVLCIPCCF